MREENFQSAAPLFYLHQFNPRVENTMPINLRNYIKHLCTILCSNCPELYLLSVPEKKTKQLKVLVVWGLLDYFNWMIWNHSIKTKSLGIIAMMDHDDGDSEAIKKPPHQLSQRLHKHFTSTPFHQSFTFPFHSSSTFTFVHSELSTELPQRESSVSKWVWGVREKEDFGVYVYALSSLAGVMRKWREWCHAIHQIADNGDWNFLRSNSSPFIWFNWQNSLIIERGMKNIFRILNPGVEMMPMCWNEFSSHLA